jgi:hypothetical protein
MHLLDEEKSKLKERAFIFSLTLFRQPQSVREHIKKLTVLS